MPLGALEFRRVGGIEPVPNHFLSYKYGKICYEGVAT